MSEEKICPLCFYESDENFTYSEHLVEYHKIVPSEEKGTQKEQVQEIINKRVSKLAEGLEWFNKYLDLQTGKTDSEKKDEIKEELKKDHWSGFMLHV